MPPPISEATYSAGSLPFTNPVTDPSTVSEGKIKRAKRALKRAKAILEDKGWIQHGSATPAGVCLTQAISEATQPTYGVRSKPGLAKLHGPVMQGVIYGLLESARPSVTRRAPAFTGASSVANWNDKSGRSKDQVFALLDAASA